MSAAAEALNGARRSGFGKRVGLNLRFPGLPRKEEERGTWRDAADRRRSGGLSDGGEGGGFAERQSRDLQRGFMVCSSAAGYEDQVGRSSSGERRSMAYEGGESCRVRGV